MIDKKQLESRIREVYPESAETFPREMVELILRETLPELEVNVQEYAENRPLSDIKVNGKLSIQDVLDYWNVGDNFFYDALYVLKLFAEHEDLAICQIQNKFVYDIALIDTTQYKEEKTPPGA